MALKLLPYFWIYAIMVSWSKGHTPWIIGCTFQLLLYLRKLRVSSWTVNNLDSFRVASVFLIEVMKPSKWSTQKGKCLTSSSRTLQDGILASVIQWLHQIRHIICLALVRSKRKYNFNSFDFDYCMSQSSLLVYEVVL